MTTTSTSPALSDAGTRTDGGVWALVAAGALFVLYPALRPWSDVTPAGAPAAFASPAWIPAHLAAVGGFVLVTAALLTLRTTLAHTGGRRLASLALTTWSAGTALVLPYYGAEAFALNAIGEHIVRTGTTDLLGVVEAVRMGTLQATVFAAGMLLLGTAGVLVAAAAARSRAFPSWSGLPFAAAFASYLPQFFATPAVRISHGVLAAVGCLVLAVAMRRAAVTA